MSEHECKQENLLRDIHGEVKTLSTEFRAMNGKLLEAVTAARDHERDSKLYRHKIDIIWAVFHTFKWIIMLVFGTGIIFRLFEWWTK